ncbi:unnamed protein product, partial [Laminaria digitata]
GGGGGGGGGHGGREDYAGPGRSSASASEPPPPPPPLVAATAAVAGCKESASDRPGYKEYKQDSPVELGGDHPMAFAPLTCSSDSKQEGGWPGRRTAEFKYASPDRFDP